VSRNHPHSGSAFTVLLSSLPCGCISSCMVYCAGLAIAS